MTAPSGDLVDDPPDSAPGRDPDPGRGPDVLPPSWFWPALAAVVAGAAVVVGYFGRRVFLWSDDYVFLLDAKGKPLAWDWLKSPLFGHFSPVSQFADVLVVENLPDHAWLIRTILLVLSVAVVTSAAFLMVSLFGRTWLTLIGTALAAPSLGLLPLVNWWTAGLNLMPSLIGGSLCLGAMVRLVRGRTGRAATIGWAALAVGSYLLAVMSWELGMTIVGYAAVWTLLFRARVSDEPLRALVRRTWWVWALLGAIGVWSVLNYRLNYYAPTPSPTLELAGQALTTSLVQIQLPLAIGFYDPSRAWFQLLGIVLAGVVTLALIALTLVRSRRAWRGWAFALLGWLIPITAVALSRVGYIGVKAVEQPMYYYLPTLLLLVGAAEAWAATWRPAPAATVPARPPIRWWALASGVLVLAGFGLAYLSSAWPTITSTNYGMIGPRNNPDRDFMSNLIGSAEALQASGQPFSVINGLTPEIILNFQGHNRLSQTTSLYDPTLPFDAPDGPWYVPGKTGALVPATIDWAASLAPAGPTDLTSTGITPAGSTPPGGGTGFCFTVDAPDASLTWTLPAPVGGAPLVVRTMAGVSADTPVRVSTVTNPGDQPVVTNVNPRVWTAGETGRLDTTPEPQISAVVIDSMTVGTSMCIDSIEAGTVTQG